MKKLLITTIALTAIGVAVKATRKRKVYSIEIGALKDLPVNVQSQMYKDGRRSKT